MFPSFCPRLFVPQEAHRHRYPSISFGRKSGRWCFFLDTHLLSAPPWLAQMTKGRILLVVNTGVNASNKCRVFTVRPQKVSRRALRAQRSGWWCAEVSPATAENPDMLYGFHAIMLSGEYNVPFQLPACP
jgi:hypothetical protein